MTLYKKKYRIEANRYVSHSYKKGMYFVTISTKKKLQWFGEIVDKKMTLNEIGEIVKEEWLKTPTIRSYVTLDAWCVMPNHIHGIILIDAVETCGAHVSVSECSSPALAHVSVTKANMTNTNRMHGERCRTGSLETGATEFSGSGGIDSSKMGVIDPSEAGVTDFSETCAPHVSTKKLLLPPKGLGSIMNQFKGTVTKKIHSMGHSDFQWQPRYHDRIIRSQEELAAIKTYIVRNPGVWDKETIPWHTDATLHNP